MTKGVFIKEDDLTNLMSKTMAIRNLRKQMEGFSTLDIDAERRQSIYHQMCATLYEEMIILHNVLGSVLESETKEEDGKARPEAWKSPWKARPEEGHENANTTTD
jgi:hypothetical protein